MPPLPKTSLLRQRVGTARHARLPIAARSPRAATSLKAPWQPKPIASRPADPANEMMAEVGRFLQKVGGENKALAGQLKGVIGHYLQNEAKVLEATLVSESVRQRVHTDLKAGKPLPALDRAHLPQTESEAVETLMHRMGMTKREKKIVAQGLQALDRGAHLPPLRQSIGGAEKTNPNTHRTQMAVTDPGIDHLAMTLADPRMLDGSLVHVEIIDRNTEHQSPYSVPSAKMVSTIRMFLGRDAPLTVFFGRPNYMASALGENVQGVPLAKAALKFNLPTAANGLTLAARGLFDRGVSEIKVTMDGLSPSEVTQFGRKVHGNIRMTSDEYISAAFNLGSVLRDFELLPTHAPPISGAPTAEQRALMLKGALQATEAAKKGSFKKVTVDSASMTPPSYPLVEYFGVENLLLWTHDAHQKGLETYGSGGMRDYHFPVLHLAGLDGVGVGFSIHEPPAPNNPGVPGRMLPEKVLSALSARNRTEGSPVGKAATQLRRLAALHADGSATPQQRALERRSLGFLRKVAADVDVKLEGLKAARDQKLAQAKTMLDPAVQAKAQSEAKSTFEAELKAVIDTEIFSAKNEAEAQKLIADGAKQGVAK